MRRISTTALIFALLAGVVMAIGKPAGDGKARRLARHYYLSGVRQDAEGHSAEAAELFRKAYESDSTYAEAALQYGIRRLGMPYGDLNDSIERAESRRIARKFATAYPGDIFPNVLYSNVLGKVNEPREAVDIMEGLLQYNPGNSDILEALSTMYLDIDEVGKAIEALDKRAAIEGEDESYFIRKATIKLFTQDTIGTLQETDKLIAKYPDNPECVAFKARIQSYLGMDSVAEVTYRLADSMAAPGAGGSIKVQMADFYQHKGDSINYDKKTYEALMADDLEFEMKQEILAYYLQSIVDDKGDWSRGDELFTVLLKQYPHRPELLSLAARYSGAKKDYKKAIEEVDYALDLDRTNPTYWEQAMTYAVMLEDYDKILDYYNRALQSIDSPSLSFYELAGIGALSTDHPQKALEMYSDALDKLFPGQQPGEKTDFDRLPSDAGNETLQYLAMLNQSIGDVYYKMGDKPRAFVSYDNSMLLNSNAPLTLNNYAYFLVEDGKDLTPEVLEKADEMSGKALILEPDNPTYLDTRAWVLFRKGEYKEAKEMELKALELSKENAEAKEMAEFYSHLGDILFMNHEPEEALEMWKKALEGTPDNELLKKKVKHRTFFYE